MARIIAGEAGSLHLEVPQGPTRPTSDRVREAMFSALASRIDFSGLRVLDLFAGSGALGLEALSRGASTLTAVDSHRAACKAIRNNTQRLEKALARPMRIDVHCKSVNSVLSRLPRSAAIDLVFMDPPYELPSVEIVEILNALDSLLHPEATIVLERSTRTPEPHWPGWLTLAGTKTYGDTRVFTLSR
ncbi:MAG: 16S rRNA (guanine(966)-N(2))-methyltransferase RsmD, partial [Pontimonas sp.]